MFLLVSVFHFVRAATEALTIGKRVVRILLECLIVLAQLLVKPINLTITVVTFKPRLFRNVFQILATMILFWTADIRRNFSMNLPRQ